MESKKPDRRMIRSRKLMQAALRDLVNEKEYRKISVADIAERAGVSRPTFYSHFKTRDDLLLSCFDSVFERLFMDLAEWASQADRSKPPGKGYTQRLVARVFEMWSGEKELVRLLLSSGTETLVLSRFHEYTGMAFQLHFEQYKHREVPKPLLSLMVQCTAGVMVSLLKEWLAKDMSYSPEFMGATYETLVNPGLESIIHGGVLDSWVESKATS